MPIVSRCIIVRSVKHRARRFLAEVKAKDEGAKEATAVGYHGQYGIRGAVGANIARTHARCVPRSLSPPAAPAGLSRPRHSVRDTIRCQRVISSSELHQIVRADIANYPPFSKKLW